MGEPIPVGIDEFRQLREEGLAYVDKSHLIKELLDVPGFQVVMLPRPRRFGKSLNLSMLRWYFEKREEDLSHLFSDLSIWQAGEKYRAHFQRYPVIHLSLKGTRAERFEDAWANIKSRIVSLFEVHRAVLDGGRIGEGPARRYREILDGTASTALFASSLFDLSACLAAHHGQRVVILLDEYDEPIHSAYLAGYAKPMLEFMRGFFIQGLKGNPHLFRGVVTGILRVSKESPFSGSNNFGVFSLLEREFRTCFGFTEAEVISLLEREGRTDRLADIRSFYNGYLFGGEAIYNPWSIMSYLGREEKRPKAYWLSTSSNDLVHELLARWSAQLTPEFEALLEGGSVVHTLEEDVSLDELRTRQDALWGLLVFTGYLKAEDAGEDALWHSLYRLSIPNREVRQLYGTSFARWMREGLSRKGGDADELTKALLSGDAETVEEQLQRFVESLLSHHDVSASDPERVYQAFVLGLLSVMEGDYLVRSNRESGHGRPDVTIAPRAAGKPGALLELKVARKGRKTPAAALREGLSQIRENDYGAEIRAAGASEVHAFAVAFDGKRAWVKSAHAEAPPRKKASVPRKRPSASKKKASGKKASATSKKASPPRRKASLPRKKASVARKATTPRR